MHFSLDFWNTIAIPNKTYAEERTRIISDISGFKLDISKKIYTATKTILDKRAEEEGKALPVHLAYRELCEGLGYTSNIDEKKWQFKSAFEELFMELPPHIPSDIVITIREMKQKGHTFSISSNTNFISGNIIKKCLDSYGLSLDFYVFSDLVGKSKPSPYFFDLVKTKLFLHCWGLVLSKDNAVHIGDHPVCDNSGNFMKYAIIEGPWELANTIKELVHV